MNKIQMFDAMAAKPRERFWCKDHKGIGFTYEQTLELIREFHGHTAPGLVIGVRMVALAMDRIKKGTLFDAVCETKSCLPDAVQMLTSCTIGNGWLKIKDLGRFAVTLYDKFTGKGARVFINPAKLQAWPEFYDWLYKVKPKEEQDFDRLLNEIKQAGETVLAISQVQVRPQYLVKRSKGVIGTCPVCGEAYPVKHGPACMGCQGEAPCETEQTPDGEGLFKDNLLKAVTAEAAVGKRLLHDMTRIIPGLEKGPAFRKGQQITSGDICRLQKMGRRTVYVEELNKLSEELVHEDEAAGAFAKVMAGDGVCFDPAPSEGKITFSAELNGLLWVNVEKLRAFNRIEGVMCATRKRFSVVKADEKIGASRAIPLFLPWKNLRRALEMVYDGPILKVLPMRKASIGILVTGTEIVQGLIKDRFIPIIRKKAEQFQCTISETLIVRDDRNEIKNSVRQLIDAGSDIIVTTAGLSVDPDDVTRQGLLDAGCENLIYGVPVLPGAMTLSARIGALQVIGVPACGLYHDITSFDLFLPRLLAGIRLSREDLSGLGHGGFCMNCNICVYPKCSFGS